MTGKVVVNKEAQERTQVVRDTVPDTEVEVEKRIPARAGGKSPCEDAGHSVVRILTRQTTAVTPAGSALSWTRRLLSDNPHAAPGLG